MDLLKLFAFEAVIHILMEGVVDRVPSLRKFCRQNTIGSVSEQIDKKVEMKVKSVMESSKPTYA